MGQFFNCFDFFCVEKRRRGAPKKESTIAKEKRLIELKDQIIKDGIISSGDDIFKALAKEFSNKTETVSDQAMYLLATRLFSAEIKKPTFKPDEAIDLYENEKYEHTVNLNIENDDLIQSFVETNAYLRGLRSYMRELITKFSYYTCDWHFDVCCSKENVIFCAGKCTECSGKVFITSNSDRSELEILLKGFNKNIVHKKNRIQLAHIKSLLKIC